MFANNYWFKLTLSSALGLCLLSAMPAAGADAVHDPHRLIGNEEFQETIEGRCTVCHTRERVDQALGGGEDLDALLQRMIERGAIVTDRDKKVLGTFWGSPTSGDRQPTSSQPGR